ncbi:peptidase M48-like protein [Motilibacter rhizosphaerae]|uniref:Peptidase M48-like protein n=1 Tax=Motilibacter rhizosphaerae TaxID=598652 RepID=A0A4Q7NH13_9ACTN|nr:M48 family metalloprotease [Motilibacter rhizosphaerae]RZS82736.1 peptidase M48-like protein [Motilibacter rhizosphaerae]
MLVGPAALVAPVVEALVLARCAPAVARRLHPATATWLLGLLALGCAASTVVTLVALVSGLSLGELVELWPRSPRPGGPVIAGLAVACTGVGLLAVLPVAGPAARDWWRARRACPAVRPPDGLLVVEESAPEAYAVPAAGGLVVVSTGMLALLEPQERAVLLAHERAHLRHRHHLHRLLVRACAVANPLLRPVVRVSAQQVERWADEVAAREVGDRTVAARSLARAALATRAPAAGLAAGGGDSAERVRALLDPAAPRRVGLVAVAAALAATMLLAAVAQADRVEDRWERLPTPVADTRHG